jgi:hypothetical protein
MNIPLNPHDLLFLLAPGAIAILTRPAWSANRKFLVALGICALAAAAEVLLSGQGLALASLKAFGLTMTAYSGFWKPLLPTELKYLETQVNAGPGAPTAGAGA